MSLVSHSPATSLQVPFPQVLSPSNEQLHSTAQYYELIGCWFLAERIRQVLLSRLGAAQ